MAESALIAALEGSIPGIHFEAAHFPDAERAKMNDERVETLGTLWWSVVGPDEQNESHEQNQKIVQEFKLRIADRYPTELSMSARLVRIFVEIAEHLSSVSMFAIEKQP